MWGISVFPPYTKQNIIDRPKIFFINYLDIRIVKTKAGDRYTYNLLWELLSIVSKHTEKYLFLLCVQFTIGILKTFIECLLCRFSH